MEELYLLSRYCRLSRADVLLTTREERHLLFKYLREDNERQAANARSGK